jgi:hypothetical protein
MATKMRDEEESSVKNRKAAVPVQPPPQEEGIKPDMRPFNRKTMIK